MQVQYEVGANWGLEQGAWAAGSWCGRVMLQGVAREPLLPLAAGRGLRASVAVLHLMPHHHHLMEWGDLVVNPEQERLQFQWFHHLAP